MLMESAHAESAESPVLSPEEARVLGCLIEKEATTPDIYPLTVNAAQSAANQKTARDPVMALDPGAVKFAESARQSGLPPDKSWTELQKIGTLEDALEDLCKKAAEVSIRSVMSIPGEERITGGEASISEAAYWMAVSGQDYLFVREGNELEGIISLSDVMGYICDTVRACRL